MGERFGYFWDATLCQRDPGVIYPEKPERLRVLSPEKILQSFEARVFSGFHMRDSRVLGLAHDSEHVEFVQNAHSAGRTVSVLEGGYNIAALQESVKEHCRALAT